MSLFVDIKKDFGSFVLESHFESEKGIVGFLGASGSGKSMTLKCIAGIETPDEGKIILNGVTLFDKEKHINLPPQKRKVGYLFQNYGLFPNMTLEKNVLAGANREGDKQKKKRIAAELIHKMQLDGLEKRKPYQLSGGQQQRAALARILVSQPDILLLDEPFSALDSYLREQLIPEMKSLLKEFGKDVIIVSHSRDEIYKLCDEIALLHDGRIQKKDTVKKIFADPGSIQGATLTGCKNIVSAEKKDKYEVWVPEWNVSFKTGNPVSDSIKAIAIRAHYFNPKTTVNNYPVELVEEVEEPFEWTLKFRYAESKEEAELIWWRLPKDKRPSKFPKQLGIIPANIMLLYE